jgi:hypothetical protein
MALTPQLPPTDYQRLERVEDRGERDRLYAVNMIYRHRTPQGMRYSKGTPQSTGTLGGWQALDAILRSDANSAAALPQRELRLARLFTALTVIAGIVTVAGVAATSREGLDLNDLDARAGLLIGGGIAAIGFGVTGGLFYGRAKKGYDRAVDVYNDSLGVRLGVLTPEGDYIPPRGSIVDENGFVVVDDPELYGPPEPPRAPESAAPESAAPEGAAPEGAAAKRVTPESSAPRVAR